MQIERIQKETDLSSRYAEHLIKSVKKTATTDAVDPDLGHPYQRQEDQRPPSPRTQKADGESAEATPDTIPPESCDAQLMPLVDVMA